jgi:hypothetical protein
LCILMNYLKCRLWQNGWKNIDTCVQQNSIIANFKWSQKKTLLWP